MAIAAVGVQPGDEVITPAYSWTSSATCILHHNAVPVFVDIDPATYNMDPAEIEAKITERTRAIVVVHLCGLAADLDAIMAIAERHHLPVVEDCCQAHGAEYGGRKVGTFGAAAAFSLNGQKLLSAGEGGLFVTRDREVWERAAAVQQFGEIRTPDGPRNPDAAGMGWMYRMPELTAAFARAQLGRLPEIIDATPAQRGHADPPARRDHGCDGAGRAAEDAGMSTTATPSGWTAPPAKWRESGARCPPRECR